MTFKEWYKEFNRSIGWYGMSAEYAIDQTAEEAWKMGFTEGVNSCRNTEPKKYTVVTAKELKPGDIIIHNYHLFKITGCGCGKGSGSLDFGEYFWIKGYYFIYPNLKTVCTIGDFWSFQECPMIKVEL